MQKFNYTGIDQTGRSVSGTMAAENVVSLEERLKAVGVWMVQAAEDKGAAVAEAAKRKATRSVRIGGGKKRRQLINYCTMMGFLVKVGVPMVQAMEIAAQDCDHVGFRSALTEVRREVESGSKLHEAMERYPGLFGSQFTSLIRAGEESGSLPESFNELKHYLEWQEQITSDVKQATIYPTVVLIMVIVFVLVLFSFVVPRFVQLLTATKVPLPLPTRMVFSVSDVMKATWWIWLSFLVLVPLTIGFARKWSQKFAIFLDRVKFKLPLFGALNHMLVMSRLAHSLAVLYRSGVNILQALKLCEDLVGSPLVAQVIRDVHDRVEGGATVSEAMRRHPVFPNLLIRMVVIGEKTGNLDHALENTADYYNLIVPRRIKKMFGVLEPAMILTLVGIVGFVALSILMPIMSLMESLR
jgi:type II secretory pathway component PulF